MLFVTICGVSGPSSAARAHFVAVGKSIKNITPCRGCSGEGWLRCTNCHGKKEITIICPRCKGKRMVQNKTGTYIFCNTCKFTGIRARFICRKCKAGYFDCRLCKLPKSAPCGSSGRTPCGTCKGKRIMQVKCSTCKGYGLNMSGTGFTSYDDYLCSGCHGSGYSSIQKCPTCPNGFIDCTQCEPLRTPPAVKDICMANTCFACEGRGSMFRGAEWACKSCLGLGLRLVPVADPKKVLPE